PDADSTPGFWGFYDYVHGSSIGIFRYRS
ncbi:MAG: hypothetical protein JWR53_658, partial [Glaciihabitans sp.]|nr:hypothetical protein [Glaciihabitans sp.]